LLHVSAVPRLNQATVYLAKNIINNILQSNPEINMTIQKEILHILQTVINKTIFNLTTNTNEQTDGLVMDAPTTSILAEIYTQHMEHTQIFLILIKQQIIAHFR
jgi:hypothetical protein